MVGGWPGVVSVTPPPPPPIGCNYSLDPPGMIRLGESNLLGVSPATNPEATASSAGCAAQCCKTRGCSAFSLDTCVTADLQRAVLCRFWHSRTPLHTNLYTAVVRTYFLSGGIGVPRSTHEQYEDT